MLSQEEKNIVENVKLLMEEEGLSLRQLEERSGVSYKTIHNLVQGLHSPKVSMAISLAKALEVSLDDLLKAPARRRAKATSA